MKLLSFLRLLHHIYNHNLVTQKINTKIVGIFTFSILTIIGFSLPSQSQHKSKNIYTCLRTTGYPSTVVDTSRGRIELIVWKSDRFRQSGWSPQKRCEEVTRRFQKFSDNKVLRYVATGTINRQKVICVAQKKPTGIRCRKDGLLITLEPNDNPSKVLDELFDISSRVSLGGLSRGTILDLDEFLQAVPLMPPSISDANTPNSTPVSRPAIIPTNPSPTLPSENLVCPETLCPDG